MAKIILTRLTCYQTEDNLGADETNLKIWSDNDYQSMTRSMNNGDEWNLNVILEFESRIKLKLYDRDNPGFPLYDDHDHLGTVIINPNQATSPGNGTFDLDGANYEIEWIPASRDLERELDQHRSLASAANRSSECNLGVSQNSNGDYIVSSDAMEELLSVIENINEIDESGDRDIFGKKHTYCCTMGNNGIPSKKRQFKAYSWQAPFFCIRMAKSAGYNSGSVSKGKCNNDDEFDR